MESKGKKCALYGEGCAGYYPFGMNMAGIEKQGQPDHKYQYNGGAEKEESFGLQWHETLFRSYDPQLGRFHQVDPLADHMSSITPYHYGFNNPIFFNDPLGLKPRGWLKRLWTNLRSTVEKAFGGDGWVRYSEQIAKGKRVKGMTRAVKGKPKQRPSRKPGAGISEDLPTNPVQIGRISFPEPPMPGIDPVNREHQIDFVRVRPRLSFGGRRIPDAGSISIFANENFYIRSAVPYPNNRRAIMNRLRPFANSIIDQGLRLRVIGHPITFGGNTDELNPTIQLHRGRRIPTWRLLQMRAQFIIQVFIDLGVNPAVITIGTSTQPGQGLNAVELQASPGN